jgi:hypothetical protein
LPVYRHGVVRKGHIGIISIVRAAIGEVLPLDGPGAVRYRGRVRLGQDARQTSDSQDQSGGCLVFSPGIVIRQVVRIVCTSVRHTSYFASVAGLVRQVSGTPERQVVSGTGHTSGQFQTVILGLRRHRRYVTVRLYVRQSDCQSDVTS